MLRLTRICTVGSPLALHFYMGILAPLPSFAPDFESDSLPPSFLGSFAPTEPLGCLLLDVHALPFVLSAPPREPLSKLEPNLVVRLDAWSQKFIRSRPFGVSAISLLDGLEGWIASSTDCPQANAVEAFAEAVVKSLLATVEQAWETSSDPNDAVEASTTLIQALTTRPSIPVQSSILCTHGLILLRPSTSGSILAHPHLSSSHAELLLQRTLVPPDISSFDAAMLRAYAISLVTHVQPIVSSDAFDSLERPLPIALRDHILTDLIRRNLPYRAVRLLFRLSDDPLPPDKRAPHAVDIHPPPTHVAESLIRCICFRRKARLIPYAVSTLRLIPSGERTISIHNHLIKHINILFSYAHHSHRFLSFAGFRAYSQQPRFKSWLCDQAERLTSEVQAMLDQHPTLESNTRTLEAHLHASPRYPQLRPTSKTMPSRDDDASTELDTDILAYLRQGRQESRAQLEGLIETFGSTFRHETWELAVKAMATRVGPTRISAVLGWMDRFGLVEPKAELKLAQIEGWAQRHYRCGTH